MAKIDRKVMKMFGSAAGPNQIAQFGSLAANAPAFTTDPEVIQQLSNYLTGWNGAVVGSNSPAIEDMNALFYLYAYQLAYIMQMGVPEWNAATTYYEGSVVNANGILYVSVQDDNLNNPVTDEDYWISTSIKPTQSIVIGDTPYQIVEADYGRVFTVQSSGGAITLKAPDPTALPSGFKFSIKDVSGESGTNAITFQGYGSETIEGLASNFTCQCDFGVWTFESDGTNWWLV